MLPQAAHLQLQATAGSSAWDAWQSFSSLTFSVTEKLKDNTGMGWKDEKKKAQRGVVEADGWNYHLEVH